MIEQEERMNAPDPDRELNDEERAMETQPRPSARGPVPGREPGKSQGGGGGPQDPSLGRRRRLIVTLAGLFVFLTFGALVAYGAYARLERDAAAQAELDARRDRVPELRIEKVKAIDTPREYHLPANTEAFDAATIYARQSGYIAQRMVDIGSRVKSGALLAVISAPEVDDQLTQARRQLEQMQATLEQTEANRALANVTNNRFTPLVQQGWETKQTGDQTKYNLAAQNAAVDVAKANIQAQKSVIARLERLQSYERVVAPFDGVITQRNIDVGSLVAADANSGTPLFAIVHGNVMRVRVRVPQDAALQLKVGMEATLDVPELPGRSFTGKVARTANALDPATRTLLIEADIENPDGTLSPGLYGTVHFLIPRPAPVVMVPASALIFDQHGMQVATYSDGTAHLQKVGIAEDDGAQVQIATGLAAGQDLILNPPAGIASGAKVKPAPEKAAQPAQAQGKS
ncbi:MAG: efflux RND transporter periplasmic adaptor subunit [Rhodomicrobium sp.]